MVKLARWSVGHRRLVVLLWIVGFLGLTGVSRVVGTGYSDSFSLHGTESSRAQQLVQRGAQRVSGDSDEIVVATRSGTVLDPAVRTRVSAMLDQVARLPHVGAVTSPYSPQGASQISHDRTIAYATVTFDEQANQLPLSAINQVVSTARRAGGSDVQVELEGQAIERTLKQGVGGLTLGIGVALLVLIVVFGTLLSAALPLITALPALGVGVAVMGLLSNLVAMPSFSSQVALLIGLGVGVDYALFVLTRFRQALLRGSDTADAVVEAIDTSGRAVLFAGLTVCIAMLSMLVLGVAFIAGIGIAASIVVACTVVSALTLLPATLGFLGPRILRRSERRRLAGGPQRSEERRALWSRWADVVARRPVVLSLAAACVMATIALPVLSLRTGSQDAGSDPTSATTRRAYDLLARGFGPGFNGPLQLVAHVSSGGERAAFTRVVAAVRRTPDVVSASPARPLGGDVLVSRVVERGSPQDASTSDLVATLRQRVIPHATQGQVKVLVGGQTAVFEDFSAVISGKLPLFIGLAVALSFVLLMTVFRSLLIPFVAALMNLLSAAAGLGVVTAVFQFGWGASLIGVSRTGPIESFLPVMVFAILFGLSMDYEVFLVSRIQEEWHRRRDNTAAVTEGLAATGRTITAAATIMVLVFAAFILGGSHTIKLFGLGLSSAVLMDAVIVRSILIPGLMIRLGPANWWMPSWLDRVLPRLHVEPAAAVGAEHAVRARGAEDAPAHA